MRTIAVIAARMGSERLPGKTLRLFEGKPLLGHLLDRAGRAKTLSEMIVATPANLENDPVAAYCAERGIPCFRGSEQDVADRMKGALEMMHADVGVELYGDSPVVDPRIIDCVVGEFLKGGADWVGNDVHPGFSSGFFAEAFSMDAFRESLRTCSDPSIREHGTLALRKDERRFRLKHIEAEGILQRPEICLSVDSPEDATMMDAIFKHFTPKNDFTAEQIIAFLDAHPEVASQNAHVHRRWRQYQQNA